MPALSRRPDAPQETWLIFYGDVRVGAIAERTGNPPGTDAWQWHCGFYPGSHPRECMHGTAASFDAARAAFETAWRVFLANRTEADFQEWRDHQAWTAEKRTMWAAGKPLPSQLPNTLMRCACGEKFDSHDSAGSYIHRRHIYEHHAKIRRAEAVC
jgi:hypothetical protein